MRNKIIQAIKNFDTNLLYHLLDDDKSYMDVTKLSFIKALDHAFQSARRSGCNAFDDVFFGICGQCNKGCEGMTFFSNTGCFLDLYFESKDEKSVDDIYVCHQLTNFTDLEKNNNLSFQFYKDEEVKFSPDIEYLKLNDQFNLLKTELQKLKNGISLNHFLEWYTQFNYLKACLFNLDIFERYEYKFYVGAYKFLEELDSIEDIMTKEQHAIEALLDFQDAKTERDKLIWLLNNEEDVHSMSCLSYVENTNMVVFNSDKLGLHIDVSGYEYVMDYFKKVHDIYEALMEKYKPLPEHYERIGEHIDYSLQAYLTLHNKHMDVVEYFKNKNGIN